MPCAFSAFFYYHGWFFLQIVIMGYSLDFNREIHFFNLLVVSIVCMWGHKSSFSRIFILEKGVLRYATTSCSILLILVIRCEFVRVVLMLLSRNFIMESWLMIWTTLQLQVYWDYIYCYYVYSIFSDAWLSSFVFWP